MTQRHDSDQRDFVFENEAPLPNRREHLLYTVPVAGIKAGLQIVFEPLRLQEFL